MKEERKPVEEEGEGNWKWKARRRDDVLRKALLVQIPPVIVKTWNKDQWLNHRWAGERKNSSREKTTQEDLAEKR